MWSISQPLTDRFPGDVIGLRVKRVRSIARWGELRLSRLPRQWQARLGGFLGFVLGVRRSTVFEPLRPASQVLVVREACIDPLLPYPTNARRPVLTRLQAFDSRGALRCRIRSHYVQVGPHIRLSPEAKNVTRVTRIEIAGTVVYCGGPSRNNWHHWLLEILPSAFHAARGEQVSVVVPDGVRVAPAQLDSVRRLFAGRDFKFLEPDQIIVAENLRLSSWWLSWQNSQSLDSIATDRRLVREFVSLLTTDIGTVKGHGPRVFLARGPGSRRPYNEDECLAVAGEYGFVPVDLGKLRFAEQVATLSQADTVVGPYGAAMANLLFARPNSRAIIIGADAKATHWDRIANIGAVELLRLPWESASKVSDQRRVDLGDLRNAFRDVT